MSDKPKGNPILGIADWLAQEARLKDAQVVLESVKKSKRSTEEDLKIAAQLSKQINAKSRETMDKIVKRTVFMKKVKELKPNADVEDKMVIKAGDLNTIKKDIDERGVQVPLVVNENNEVVCGITRWKACSELGIEEVPCFVGNWDLYNEMIEYAIKDNVIRRQLTGDEVLSYMAMVNRQKGAVPVGRPPKVAGTKREVEAVTQKVNKVIAKAASQKKERELEKTINKDYKLVVGKNHHEDEIFADKVGKEVTQQIELLKKDKAEIWVHVKYEVKS